VKTSGWGINSYRIWKPCYVVQTISLSTSGQLRFCSNLADGWQQDGLTVDRLCV